MAAGVSWQQDIKWVQCGGPHHLETCSEFKSSSPQACKPLTIEKKLCLKCLGPGHFVAECRSAALPLYGKGHLLLHHIGQFSCRKRRFIQLSTSACCKQPSSGATRLMPPQIAPAQSQCKIIVAQRVPLTLGQSQAAEFRCKLSQSKSVVLIVEVPQSTCCLTLVQRRHFFERC